MHIEFCLHMQHLGLIKLAKSVYELTLDGIFCITFEIILNIELYL